MFISILLQVILVLASTTSCKSRMNSQSELNLSKARGLEKSDPYSSIIGSLYSVRGEDFCTATLVNSCNIITATHCAQNLFLEGFRTNRGDKAEIGDDMFSIVPADQSKPGLSDDTSRLTDISIVRLKNEIHPKVQIQIADGATLQPGERLTLFGASTISRLTGGPDVQQGIGIFERYKLKEGSEYRKDIFDSSTKNLDKITTNTIVLRGSDDPSKGSMICGGDSGGPTLDKDKKLVGIHQGSASIEMVFLCFFDKKSSRKIDASIPSRDALNCSPDKQIDPERFSTGAVTITGCIDRRPSARPEDQDRIWRLEKYLSFCKHYGNLATFADLKHIAADEDLRNALVPGQKNGPGAIITVAEIPSKGDPVFHAASSKTGEVFSDVNDQFFCNQTIESYDSSVVHYKNAINKILDSTKHRCSNTKAGMK